VGTDFYQVLRRSDYFTTKDEKLCYQISNPSTVTVLNLTSQEKMFCRENLRKFADVSKVPQQDWYLVVNESHGEIGYHRYQLNEEGLIQNGNGTRAAIQETDSAPLDFESSTPSDIIQIGSLLESKQEGIQGVNNNFSLLTSTGKDLSTNLPLLLNFKLLSTHSDPL